MHNFINTTTVSSNICFFIKHDKFCRMLDYYGNSVSIIFVIGAICDRYLETRIDLKTQIDPKSSFYSELKE